VLNMTKVNESKINVISSRIENFLLNENGPDCQLTEISVERIVITPEGVKIIFHNGKIRTYKPNQLQILDENKNLRYIDEVLALIS